LFELAANDETSLKLRTVCRRCRAHLYFVLKDRRAAIVLDPDRPSRRNSR
jgi:hypothetical protein